MMQCRQLTWRRRRRFDGKGNPRCGPGEGPPSPGIPQKKACWENYGDRRRAGGCGPAFVGLMGGEGRAAWTGAWGHAWQGRLAQEYPLLTTYPGAARMQRSGTDPAPASKCVFFREEKKEKEEARHAQLAFSRHVGSMLERALPAVPGGLGTSLGARSRPAWTTGCPQSLPLSVDRPCGLPSCPHLLGLGPAA